MTAPMLGSPKVNAVSGTCCGKPHGCNMTHQGCVYLRHPAKRALLGDQTVRCQAKCIRDGAELQCRLLNGHAGACEPRSS